MKGFIYFVDEDKFGNERHRYVMPKNEINLTMQELHCKETAGHLGMDKTIVKINSRFFWTNLSRDVKNILAICDHFIKHVKVFRMKGQTAKEVAEKCLDYCIP